MKETSAKTISVSEFSLGLQQGYESAYESLNNPEAGTIITAGTGSGKTLAYYLPSFLGICDLINKDQKSNKGIAVKAIGPECSVLIKKVFKNTL